MKPKHDTQWPPPGVRDLKPEPGWLKHRDAITRGEAVHREAEEYIRSLSGREFPCGYDVAGLEHGRTYDMEQRPLPRIGHVALVDDAWRCTRPGCPERTPVRARTAPTCYTCQQPMAMVKTELRWKPLGDVAPRLGHLDAADATFTLPFVDPEVGAVIDEFKRQIAEANAMSAAVLGRAPTERCEPRWFVEADVGVPRGVPWFSVKHGDATPLVTSGTRDTSRARCTPTDSVWLRTRP